MASPALERLRATALYLIASTPAGSDPSDLPPAWWAAVEAAIRGGAGAVQLRAKGATTAQTAALVEDARQRLGSAALWIVNDDLQAALDSGADGLHLGREDAARLAPHSSGIAGGLAWARSRLGPERLLGTSTRQAGEVATARASGVDHVGFGAMSVSRTKRHTTPADPAELARCAAAFPDLPIFPIGGLGPATLGPVREAGVRRAAVGSAVLDAVDPEAAARELRHLLATD